MLSMGKFVKANPGGKYHRFIEPSGRPEDQPAIYTECHPNRPIIIEWPPVMANRIDSHDYCESCERSAPLLASEWRPPENPTNSANSSPNPLRPS